MRTSTYIQRLSSQGIRELQRTIDKRVYTNLSNILLRKRTREFNALDRKRVLAFADKELTRLLSVNGEARASIFKTIVRAANSEQLALESIHSRDVFNLTFEQRLNRAKKRVLKSLDSEMRVAINRGYDSDFITRELSDIYQRHSPLRALVAYDTARAFNLANLDDYTKRKIERVRVVINAKHAKEDVCDTYAGVYDVKRIALPPYHPYCLCYIVEA